MNKGRLFSMQVISLFIILLSSCRNKEVLTSTTETDPSARERISLNRDWQFMKYEDAAMADDLIYDVRPEVEDKDDVKPADARPTEAVQVQAEQ